MYEYGKKFWLYKMLYKDIYYVIYEIVKKFNLLFVINIDICIYVVLIDK